MSPRLLTDSKRSGPAGYNSWSSWIRDVLPRTFEDAANSIASAQMPLYISGGVCCILLLGDLVRMGIVSPPTVEQMAHLIVKAFSGAMKGLEVLGYSRAEEQVTAARLAIRNTLNEQLHEGVKALFYGGEVG